MLMVAHVGYSNWSAAWKCVDHRNINAKDVETIDTIESESEDDDDDELIALPVEFAEHDDSAGSQDENNVDNEMQRSDDDVCDDV